MSVDVSLSCVDWTQGSVCKVCVAVCVCVSVCVSVCVFMCGRLCGSVCIRPRLSLCRSVSL